MVVAIGEERGEIVSDRLYIRSIACVTSWLRRS